MKIFRRISSPTTFDSRVSRTQSVRACVHVTSAWRAFWERCRLSNLSKDTNTLDERLEINYAEGIITARRIEWASRFVEQCLSTLGKLSSLWAVRPSADSRSAFLNSRLCFFKRTRRPTKACKIRASISTTRSLDLSITAKEPRIFK